MKLLFDIGNTSTKFSYADNFVVGEINFMKSSDLISNNFGFDLNNVDEAYISSVVPNATEILTNYLKNNGVKKVVKITTDIASDILLDIDNPKELGSDLYADLVGALALQRGPTIIIDCGTATKVLYISDRNVFSFCAIFNGLENSIKSLASKAALIDGINNLSFKPLSNCRNTNDVLCTSAYYSQVGSLNYMVREIDKEQRSKSTVIITGGYVPLLKDRFDFEYIYEPNLTLRGVNELSKRL